MADFEYSDLSPASALAGTDEWGINQGGTSKRATASQVNDFVSVTGYKPNLIVQNVNFTMPANYSLVIPRKHTINSGFKMTLGSGSIFRIL